MSSTRRQNGDGPLRQERFASSQEFETGLKASLVAKRCTVLDRAEDRELVWFLQLLSHQDGGLKKLTAQILERFADRIATPSMRQFGTKAGQVYNAGQVKKVRAEMLVGECQFLLRGETSFSETTNDFILGADGFAASESLNHPSKYPASVFVECCRTAAAEHLERRLIHLCVDPSAALTDGQPWYFPTLVSTLRELKTEWIAAHAPAARTVILKAVYDALDYALESRSMAVVTGQARTGKSFAAKSWCEQHPGQARLIEVPPGNADATFYRALARGLGLGNFQQYKSLEIQERVESILLRKDILLCLDESHRLWPETNLRYGVPKRINWLMSMSNEGVPIFLIGQPQFFQQLNAADRIGVWNSAQFVGRIGHCEELPGSVSADDLRAIARVFLPEGDNRSIQALAAYAESSARYLAGIETATKRARFIARREGRAQFEFRDLKRAIQESAIPSDAALAGALNPGAPGKPSRKRAICVPARPLQTDFQPAEIAPQSRRFEIEPDHETPALVEALS